MSLGEKEEEIVDYLREQGVTAVHMSRFCFAGETKMEQLGFQCSNAVMHIKDAGGIANNVDYDQTVPSGRNSLIWVCTVCSDLSFPIVRIFVELKPGTHGLHIFYLQRWTGAT